MKHLVRLLQLWVSRFHSGGICCSTAVGTGLVFPSTGGCVRPKQAYGGPVTERPGWEPTCGQCWLVRVQCLLGTALLLSLFLPSIMQVILSLGARSILWQKFDQPPHPGL